MQIPILVTAVLCAVRAGTVLPESAPAAAADFTGTWVLDVAESDFGMSPAPDSAITVISRADEHLVMTRNTFAAMAAHGMVRFDMPTDGAPYDVSMEDGQTTEASAWWEDDVLVLVLVVHSNVGEIEVTEWMTLGDDGQTITISRLLAVPGMGDLPQTLVLRRRA